MVAPGVIGGISLVLALYAMHILPVAPAGVVLVFLALGLFILEAKYTSHGVLALGGIVAMLLGALMLVRSPLTHAGVSLGVAVGVTLPFALITILLMRLVLKLALVETVDGARTVHRDRRGSHRCAGAVGGRRNLSGHGPAARRIVARRCQGSDSGRRACARDSFRRPDAARGSGRALCRSQVQSRSRGSESARGAKRGIRFALFVRRKNGYFAVWACNRGVSIFYLVLEFALRDQGMGARRGSAPGAHEAGREGPGLAPGFLADRDALRGFRCASKRWMCLRRTSSRATTSR